MATLEMLKGVIHRDPPPLHDTVLTGEIGGKSKSICATADVCAVLFCARDAAAALGPAGRVRALYGSRNRAAFCGGRLQGDGQVFLEARVVAPRVFTKPQFLPAAVACRDANLDLNVAALDPRDLDWTNFALFGVPAIVEGRGIALRVWAEPMSWNSVRAWSRKTNVPMGADIGAKSCKQSGR